MSTFKDAVLQEIDEVKEDPKNVYTYEQLQERLATAPKGQKVCEHDEALVDFINVNIDNLIDLVVTLKEQMEPHGIMNTFATQDLIDTIYQTAKISEVPEETSEEECDMDDDETLLDP